MIKCYYCLKHHRAEETYSHDKENLAPRANIGPGYNTNGENTFEGSSRLVCSQLSKQCNVGPPNPRPPPPPVSPFTATLRVLNINMWGLPTVGTLGAEYQKVSNWICSHSQLQCIPLILHESSPKNRGGKLQLWQHCPQMTPRPGK